MTKKVKLVNLNEINVIKLYELKYINQETFFNLVTGCGEQTEYEEGLDRLVFYLELVANINQYDYFIIPYSDNVNT